MPGRSSSSPSPEPSSALARGSRRLLIVVAALALLWLALVNTLLWTGGVAALISGERERSTIELEHGWAWCVWPTVVHVQNLRLAIDGARWQLELNVLSGEVDLELRELLKRRLAVRSLAAIGATAHFSIKRPYGDHESAYEGFHRLEGMPAPVREAEPRPVPAQEDAWEIDLQGIDVGVRELQINALRAKTQARLKGSLDVLVAHRFAVPTVELELEKTVIERIDETIVEDLSATLTARIEAYNPEEVQGRAALRRLSAEASVGASLAGLAPLMHLMGPSPVELSEGAGRVSSELEIREGVVQAGSFASYQTPRVVLSRSIEDRSLAVRAELRVRAEVSAEGGEKAGLQLEATASDVQGQVDSSEEPWMSAEKLEARAQYPRADLVDGVGTLRSAKAELPSFEVHQLSVLNGLTGAPLLRGGRLAGKASVKAEATTKKIGLDFAVDVDDLSLRKGKLALRTNGYVRSEGVLELGEGGITLHLEPLRAKLRQLDLTTAHGRSTFAWLAIDRAALEYGAHGSKSSRMTLDARGQLSELRSLFAHLRDGEGLAERLPQGLLGSKELDFDLSLTKSDGAFALEVSRLKGGLVDAVAAVSSAGKETRIAVHLQRIGVGILSAGNGSRNIKLAVGSGWFAEKKGWVERLTGGSGD